MTKTVDRANASPSVRLDVWLWAARFFKTRSLAKQAIEAGKIQINGVAGKAARGVRTGDTMNIARGEDRFEIAVTQLAEKRGNAKIAATLYLETDASRVARLAAAEQRRMALAGYAKPPGKPDKRARRLIRALGDLDAL